jgi:hypothetical protein
MGEYVWDSAIINGTHWRLLRKGYGEFRWWADGAPTEVAGMTVMEARRALEEYTQQGETTLAAAWAGGGEAATARPLTERGSRWGSLPLVLAVVAALLLWSRSCAEHYNQLQDNPGAGVSCGELKAACQEELRNAPTADDKVKVLNSCGVALRARGCI